jgi:hypothetical protein
MTGEECLKQSEIIGRWIKETQEAFNKEDVSSDEIISYLAQKQMGWHKKEKKVETKKIVVDKDTYNAFMEDCISTGKCFNEEHGIEIDHATTIAIEDILNDNHDSLAKKKIKKFFEII